MSTMADRTDELGARIAVNRARQRELYGAPLGDRVRRLTGLLRISQARLARALGLSPAMLSQLASGRRVKIGDPAVLARMLVLDQRCRGLVEPPPRAAVEELLTEAARADWRWAQWAWSARGGPAGHGPTAGHGSPARPQGGRRDAARTPADALRGIAEPARLAAAAAALGPTFPELAEVLRQAAGRPRPARAD
jgi:transcriptional regulator with XRE-family HTH domain